MSSQKSKSKPKQKAPIRRGADSTTPIVTDPRFASIHHDPHFAVPKRKSTKVRVDERFERMLHDDAFSSTATSVDQYGRPISRKEGRQKLARFYDFGDKEEEDEDDEEEENPRYDPARGEGLVDTSSEDEDDDDLDVDDDEVEQTRQDIDAAANVPVGEVSKRFAVVNLDWDNVRAYHLFKTFSSFAPSGGKVVKVSVYPSEFGKERMEREEVEGPLPEYFSKNKDEGKEDDEEVTAETIIKEDKGEEDKAALRQWKLDKLQYYYAVVECDTPEAAAHIYNTCDGTEYETTANFFDLRFIPDETSFEDDTPRDECDTMPETYTANDFVTDALQHSKVTLNWDEDDVQRQRVAKRAFSQKDIEENELKAYLASDTESDEDSGKEASKEKYRALLGGMSFGKKGDKDGDMEITFTSALGENEGGKVIADEGETTIEKYARKEKERKQRRKEKLRATKAEAEGVSVEDLAQQNTSKNKKQEEPEEPSQAAVELGFDDPFFDEPVQSIKNAKKEKKKKDREEKAKQEAAEAAKRAELELLMADEEEGLGEDGKKMKHFDMKQILKAEKEKNKKNKRRHKKTINEGDAVQEGFEMDVKDPRFQALYEKHQFAIDPTNPKFVKTEGMQKLLEERRKRAQMREPLEEDASRKSKKRKTADKGDDIKKLVQSLKSKNTTKA